MTKWVNQTGGAVAGFSMDPWQIFQFVGSSDYTFACPFNMGDIYDTGVGWQVDGTVVNSYGYPVTLQVGNSPQNDYVLEVKVKTPASGAYASDFALIGRAWNSISGSYDLQFGIGAVFRLNYDGGGTIKTRNVLSSWDGGTPTLVAAGDDFAYNTFSLAANTEYMFRIEIKGREVRSYVDGVLSKTNTWSGTSELDTLKLCKVEAYVPYNNGGSYYEPSITSVVVSDEFYPWTTPGASDGALLMSI